MTAPFLNCTKEEHPPVIRILWSEGVKTSEVVTLHDFVHRDVSRPNCIYIVTCLVTIDGYWIDNWI
jgi:hypothetical protein